MPGVRGEKHSSNKQATVSEKPCKHKAENYKQSFPSRVWTGRPSCNKQTAHTREQIDLEMWKDEKKKKKASGEWTVCDKNQTTDLYF